MFFKIMDEEAFLEVKKKGTKQGREFNDSTGEKAIQRRQRDLSLPKEKSKSQMDYFAKFCMK